MYTRLEAGGPVQFSGFNGELICPAYHELCNVACVPGNGQCPGPCNFDGDCIEGSCHCFLGFYSHDCSKRSCPNNCSGHGTYHSNGICECKSVRAGIDWSTGNCDGLVNPKLENNYNKTEMFNMIEAAAACVQHFAPKRPRIQVVRALDSQDDMPNLTNGIKYGQSQVFNQDQTSADMQKFRQMAFGNDTDTLEYDSGEYDRQTTTYSGEFRSREHKPPPQTPPNYESDTGPMLRSERNTNGGGNYQYGERGFL